jgi:hypothetical protein
MLNVLNLKTVVAVAALALAGVAGSSASAKASDGDGPWCAVGGGRSGYENCGYFTFRQCRAAVSGVGGACRPNPRYARYDDDDRPVRVYRRVVYYYYD